MTKFCKTRVLLSKSIVVLLVTFFYSEVIAADDETELVKSGLTSENVETRRWAVNHVRQNFSGKRGEFETYVVALLDDPDQRVRVIAAATYLDHDAAYKGSDRTEKAFERIHEGFDSDLLGLRLLALEVTLGSEAPKSSVAIDLCRIVLSTDDGSLRRRLLSKLGRMKASEESLLFLATALKNAVDKKKAVEAVAAFGFSASSLAENLLPLLQSDDRELVISTHAAIRRVAPSKIPFPSPAERFIPALIKDLKSQDVDCVLSALLHLDGLAVAKDDTPAEMLRAVDWLEKQNALDLGLSGLFYGWEEHGLLPLIDVIKKYDQRDPRVATLAVGFLSNVNAANNPVAQRVLPLIDEVKNNQGQGQLLETLGNTGRDWPEAMIRVYAALDAADPVVRLGGVRGLSWSEKNLPVKVAARVKQLQADPDPKIAENATRIFKSWEQLHQTSPGGRIE